MLPQRRPQLLLQAVSFLKTASGSGMDLHGNRQSRAEHRQVPLLRRPLPRRVPR